MTATASIIIIIIIIIISVSDKSKLWVKSNNLHMRSAGPWQLQTRVAQTRVLTTYQSVTNS